jgi:antitoxin component of RelBE/YafQ-DinJ toxin-antitoxin module
VQRYIEGCDICQRTKHGRHLKYGKMWQETAPIRSWQSITMDFTGRLPESQHGATGVIYDEIMVIVDKLTKMAYLIPAKIDMSAMQVAKLLIERVFAVHGLPGDITTDRDKLFVSALWQTLMEMMDAKHKVSTAHHQQTDRQSERVIQTIKQYLRGYVNY